MGLGTMGSDGVFKPHKDTRQATSQAPKKPYYSVKRDNPRSASQGAAKKAQPYPVKTHAFKYPSKASATFRRRSTAGVQATIIPGETHRKDLTVRQLHHEKDINAMSRKKRLERDDARRPGPRGTVVAGQPTHCAAKVKENIMMEQGTMSKARPPPPGSRKSVAGQTSHKIEEARGFQIMGKVRQIADHGESGAGLGSHDMRMEDHVDDLQHMSRLGPVGTDDRPWDPDAAGLASCLMPQGDHVHRICPELPASRALMTDFPPDEWTNMDEYQGGRRKFVDRDAAIKSGMIVGDDDCAGKASARSPRARLRRAHSDLIWEDYAGLTGSRRNEHRDPYAIPKHGRSPRNKVEVQIAMGDIPIEFPAGVMSERRHGLRSDMGVKRYLQTLTIDTSDRVFGGEKDRPDPVLKDCTDVNGRVGNKYIGRMDYAYNRNIKPLSEYWHTLTRDGSSPAGALSPRNFNNSEVNRKKGSGQHLRTTLNSALVAQSLRHSYSANSVLGDEELFMTRKRRNGPVQPQIDQDGQVIAGQPTHPTYSRGDLSRRLGESLSCQELPQRPDNCPQFSASPRYGQLSQISFAFSPRAPPSVLY